MAREKVDQWFVDKKNESKWWKEHWTKVAAGILTVAGAVVLTILTGGAALLVLIYLQEL